nr:glycosyltransferase family 4 protein [Fundidesulfovibrio soli]
MPPTTGTRVRLAGLIRALKANGNEIGFVGNVTAGEREHITECRSWFSDLELRTVGATGAQAAPLGDKLARLARVAAMCLTGTPLFAALVRHPFHERAVRKLAPGYDALLVEFFFMALNAPEDVLEALGPRAALVEHDISFVPKRRAFQVAPWPGKLLLWLRYRLWKLEETRQLRRFRTVVAMSGHDAGELRALAPQARVIVAPNGVDTASIRPSPGPRPMGSTSLLFVGGMGHAPNLDAVRHFVREHMPLLRRAVPGVSLTVAGDTAGMDLSDLAGPDVRFTGFVEDLAPLYAGCAASVAPFRIGGGTRLKILESMAAGLPVITSAVGAEGLPLEHRKSALFAEGPAETLAALRALREEPGLADALSEEARRLCVERFDWTAIAAGLERDLKKQMETHRAH